MTGVGKIEYPNGDCYEGEVFVGKKHGNGVLKYKNGNIYEG